MSSFRVCNFIYLSERIRFPKPMAEVIMKVHGKKAFYSESFTLRKNTSRNKTVLVNIAKIDVKSSYLLMPVFKLRTPS